MPPRLEGLSKVIDGMLRSAWLVHSRCFVEVGSFLSCQLPRRPPSSGKPHSVR